MLNWLDIKINESKNSLTESGFPPTMNSLLEECKPNTGLKIKKWIINWNEKMHKSDKQTN